jgi:hypothetical protein
MASIILNELFYPDIVNIILDYVMIGKDIIGHYKNININFIELLSDQLKMTHNKKTPRLLLRLIRLYNEGDYNFIKHIKK